MTYKLLCIVLLLYVSFPALGQTQNIYLDIESSNQRIDSIASIYFPERIFKNKNRLKESLDKSKDSLLKNGYFKHRLINLISSQDSIYRIQFLPGPATGIIKLKFESNLVRSNAKALNIKIDSSHIYIRPNKLQEVFESFVDLDTKNGRPLSNYYITTIDVSKDTAQARLVIKNTSPRIINDIQIKGYEKFPKSFLKYFTKLKKNKPYNEEQLSRSYTNLKRLNFISISKEPDVLFKKDSTSIYVYVVKKNANQFEGFLGFASNENDSGLRLNGNLNLKLNNTLNYGEQLQIQFRGNGDDQQQLEASLRMPYIFKSPLSATPSLRLFRQDSTFSTSETSLKIDFTKSSKFLINTQISQIKSNQLKARPSATIENFTKTILSTGFELTGDNSTKAPFEYNYFSFEGGYALRKNETQPISLNQLLLNSEASYTFDFNTKHKFYFKNNSAYISPKQLLENEMFRLGGMQTIRGYKENNFYASFFSTLQTEYRFKPQNNITINSVLDAAYFENSISKQSELLFGVGLGGSILTQAGWLRINIATPIGHNSDFAKSKPIIHISLVSIF